LQRVLTTVTILGLLVATAAAFAITEHLKLIKSPVYGTLVSKVLSPVCHCSTSTAAIRIKVRQPDRVTVTIVDSGHNRVATIGSSVYMRKHEARSFPWNGRTISGALAPDGVYYPWVHLVHAHRTFRFINRIVLDTTKPKVLSAKREKPVLLAAPGRSIAIRYAFSEPAHAILYLGRQRLVVGRPTRERSKIKWSGRVYGRPVREGRYVLSIGALDEAGNETSPSARKRVPVVVRYLVLTPHRLTAHPGSRVTLHVETGSPRYSWRLGRRHGEQRGKVLQVLAPSTPGTYRLVVSEDGHRATTLVRVGRK